MLKIASLVTFLNVCLSANAIIRNGPDGRILSGLEVPQGEGLPYQVSVQRRINGENRHICGGAILSPTFVVTAAHCCYNLPANSITIVGNTTNLNDQYLERINVLEVFPHPDYNEQSFRNDVAMIRTEQMPLNGRTMMEIALGSTTVRASEKVWFSGWGTNEQTSIKATLEQILSGNYLNTKLRIMEATTMTRLNCQLAVIPSQIFNEHLCTTSLFSNACPGDSGGPLVFNFNGNVELVGVLKVKEFCRPSVDIYERVTSYIDFIREVMGQ